MNKRQTRSDKYQYLLIETPCAAEFLDSFSNSDSIYNRLNPFAYNEELLQLEDQLKKQMWHIINTQLTNRQKEILLLWNDGYTQMEIAKILNVNQSSVTKSLNGNYDYATNKRYGGVQKKLKKIVENDPVIQDLLEKIEECRTEKW